MLPTQDEEQSWTDLGSMKMNMMLLMSVVIGIIRAEKQ